MRGVRWKPDGEKGKTVSGCPMVWGGVWANFVGGEGRTQEQSEEPKKKRAKGGGKRERKVGLKWETKKCKQKKKEKKRNEQKPPLNGKGGKPRFRGSQKRGIAKTCEKSLGQRRKRGWEKS